MNQPSEVLVAHSKWLKGEEGGERADLCGANLRGADLSYANLRVANLRVASLRGANLYGANLRDTDLRGANLRGANLRGANLGGASLGDASLGGANLRGANLYGANLRGAKLCDADLHGANLNNANLSGANLYGAAGILRIPVGDPRGYDCVAVRLYGGWEIITGCRTFSAAEARIHWGPRYAGNRSIGDRYLAGLDWLESADCTEPRLEKTADESRIRSDET